MKCFKYLICVFVKHLDIELWKLNWKPGGKNYLNLSFYFNHRYIHISKQILEYLFHHGILGCSLDNSVDYDNFAAVNNLTIIFYTKLTKIWFSIIMIQAITYMTYWFTVANTGQRKPFHQSCICSKTMQQISFKGHHPGHEVYGEYGAESIHKIFRSL